MHRRLNVKNIISAKDAAMLSAYGDKAEKVLTEIFDKIQEASLNKKRYICFPEDGHSLWALDIYLSTFGYSVMHKYNPVNDNFLIYIYWETSLHSKILSKM